MNENNQYIEDQCTLFTYIMSEHAKIWIFAGTGNQGAKALVAARFLINKGLDVKCYLLNTSGNSSESFDIEKEKLMADAPNAVEEVTRKLTMPSIKKSDLVIDGVFGDLVKPLRGGYKMLDYMISETGAQIIPIDYE